MRILKFLDGIYRMLAEKQMLFAEEKVEDVEEVMDVLVDDPSSIEKEEE